MSELIHCPFCGSLTAPRISDGTESGMNFGSESFFNVLCDGTKDGCGAQGSYHDTEAEAIEAWNTRADE